MLGIGTRSSLLFLLRALLKLSGGCWCPSLTPPPPKLPLHAVYVWGPITPRCVPSAGLLARYPPHVHLPPVIINILTKPVASIIRILLISRKTTNKPSSARRPLPPCTTIMSDKKIKAGTLAFPLPIPKPAGFEPLLLTRVLDRKQSLLVPLAALARLVSPRVPNPIAERRKFNKLFQASLSSPQALPACRRALSLRCRQHSRCCYRPFPHFLPGEGSWLPSRR